MFSGKTKWPDLDTRHKIFVRNCDFHVPLPQPFPLREGGYLDSAAVRRCGKVRMGVTVTSSTKCASLSQRRLMDENFMLGDTFFVDLDLVLLYYRTCYFMYDFSCDLIRLAASQGSYNIIPLSREGLSLTFVSQPYRLVINQTESVNHWRWTSTR